MTDNTDNGYDNSGTGGYKHLFFKALSKKMKKKGWNTVNAPGFEWSGIETANHDIDSLYAAFDADNSEILEGAHLKLSRWADTQQNMPATRIAMAVFNSIEPNEIEYIVNELQKGTRMGIQSMTGVIDLSASRCYEPQEGGGKGYQRIRINKFVFNDFKAVVETLADIV